MTKKERTKVERTAGVVVFRRRWSKVYYLLLQRIRGNWVFPGGKIEVGERFIDTARRETGEETGISRIKIYPNFREIVRFKYKWPPKTEGAELRYKTFVLFLGEVFTSQVVVEEIEHKAYKWLTYEQALKTLKHKNNRTVLTKAHEHIMSRSAHQQKSQKSTDKRKVDKDNKKRS